MRIPALVALALFLTLGTLYAQAPILVTVASGTVAVGATMSLPVTLENATSGLAGFDMTAVITDPNVAEISGATFPPFGDAGFDLSLVTSTSPGTSLRVAIVDLAGLVQPGATGQHELVTFDVVGILSGRSTTLELVIRRIDDEDGDPIAATVQIGTVTVEFPILQGKLSPVQDLNGDGLAEDINANGRTDFADVVDFFWAFGDVEVTGNVHVFDFNGNALLDFDDIVTLFQSTI